MDVKELAERFVELIKERDFIVEFNETYNDRCIEIDDQEIPAIIKQIPKGMKDGFDELINSILVESSIQNKIPPPEEGIDPSWINGFKGCI